MAGVFLLGVGLVAVPLYFWRRPRSLPDPTIEGAPTVVAAPAVVAGNPLPESSAPVAPSPSTAARVTLGPYRISCSDGSSKYLQTNCGSLPALEKDIEKAVLEVEGCVGAGESGSAGFVVQANFARKKNQVMVTMSKDTRTLRAKTANQCLVDLRKALRGTSLSDAHTHARYRLETMATYAVR